MSHSTVPEQFAELEPIVARWARPTERERFANRLGSSLHELDAMYQQLLPRFDEIMAYLDRKPAGPAQLDEADRNLAYLAMAAMENARSVEVWRKVDVHSANFTPDRIQFYQ